MSSRTVPSCNFVSSPAVRLNRTFYESSTEEVALGLLGQLLVRRTEQGNRLSGIVVEVEAYLSRDDLACHSNRGQSKKNASMFLPAGRLYVYAIHSRYCLNVVTEMAGAGAAVLIRAIEPCEGIQEMARLRGGGQKIDGQNISELAQLDGTSLVNLTAGPGRLCQALGIDRRFDGIDLCSSETVWLEQLTYLPGSWNVRSTSRIGISQAQELELRWFIDGNRFVSGRARQHSQGRTWSFNPELRP